MGKFWPFIVPCIAKNCFPAGVVVTNSRVTSVPRAVFIPDHGLYSI